MLIVFELLILCDNGKVLGNCLSDDHSVKRIRMQQWKIFESSIMLYIKRQNVKRIFESLLIEI